MFTHGAGSTRVVQGSGTTLSHLSSRIASVAPGSVLALSVYVSSRQVWVALLACVLGPPAVAAGRVAAEWVELLRPTRRLRRPRRRGS